MKVSILGAGYVGLVAGTCLADAGHDVVVADVDASKIERLNAGEVPNLFANDEKAQICDQVRDVARQEGAEGDGSPTTLFAYFVTRCRALLHICLAMSPIGDAFRTRLRMFPSLVNCCTIDWFGGWNAEAGGQTERLVEYGWKLQ